MVKATKNRQIWFALAKVFLFLVVIFVFYRQLQRSDLDLNSIEVQNAWSLLFAALLMPISWLPEFVKWRTILNVSETSYTPKIEVQSFAAGIVTGMITPNMLGNFLGRMYYFRRRERISITILTLYSNYAQFLASMIFGCLAIILLNDSPLGSPTDKLIWLGALLVLLGILAFFYFEPLLEMLFPKRIQLQMRLRSIKRRRSFKWKILSLSIFRLLIFTCQFALVLHAFGAELGLEEIWWIWQYYFWVTLVPSLFLGKFLVRDSVALWVLGYAAIETNAILPASLSIWIINLLIPTFVSFILAQQKNN
jgi:hypothetical protein